MLTILPSIVAKNVPAAIEAKTNHLEFVGIDFIGHDRMIE
jgi:hypothetical protein